MFFLWISNEFIKFLAEFNSSLSFLISCLSPSIFPLDSSLIEALFFIILALYANLSVERVSEKAPEAGEILAIINVLEFPPSESLSKKVNLESLYLIWYYFPSVIYTNVFITQPKTVRDLLIFPASLSLSPTAAVYFYLSEPAKSTKCNFDVFIKHSEFTYFFFLFFLF